MMTIEILTNWDEHVACTCDNKKDNFWGWFTHVVTLGNGTNLTDEQTRKALRYHIIICNKKN